MAWVLPRSAGAAGGGAGSRDAGALSSGGLFPPDLAAAGLDLDALVVVHVPTSDVTAGPRATELLLRTGAFGAVVLDLTERALPRGTAWQGRLIGLAREHATRVLLLSPRRQDEPSLGALIAVRLEVARARVGPGRFRLDAHVLKDKSGLYARGAPRLDDATRQGPVGLHFSEAGRPVVRRSAGPRLADERLTLISAKRG